MWARQFIPVLFMCMREGYSLKRFWKDLSAGLGLALLALPLNMAFAIAAGLPPEYGVYTAVISGSLATIFGGSPVAIGGPTGSFVIIVYTILEQYGYEGLATATCMAGFILLIMAFIGCGQLLQLVSYPVIRGFTSGIAIVIMSLQMRDFLGLHPKDPLFSHFTSACLSNWECLHTYSITTIALGMSCLLFLIIAKKFFPRLPSYAIVLFVSTCIVSFFALPVETIASRFGTISDTFPTPSLPNLQWHAMQPLFSSAFTIAMLCALESLLTAVVADEMAGTRHSSNGELFGQGLANIGAAFFQGMPAAAGLARTAANIRMGGQSPIAALVHIAVMLITVLFFAHYAKQVPLTALAAVLLVVSWQMSEFGRVRALLHAPRGDLIIFFLTFFLTIFVDLTVAVEAGVLLSVFFFIRQLRDTSSFQAYQALLKDQEQPTLRQGTNGHDPAVEFLTLHGPLFFGTSDILQELQKQIKAAKEVNGRVWVVRMAGVPFVDVSGIQALFELKNNCTRIGVHLILAEVNESAQQAIKQADHEGCFGSNEIFNDLDGALAAAKRIKQTN